VSGSSLDQSDWNLRQASYRRRGTARTGIKTRVSPPGLANSRSDVERLVK
jgi:hypothetical protein